MPAACSTPRTVSQQYRIPEWQPLLDAVGDVLVADFMWMHCETLEDGTCVEAYKHRETRCYLYLGDDGRAYVPAPCDRLVPLRLDRAIKAALCSWWLLHGSDDAVREEIRRVIDRVQATIDMREP